MTLAYPPRRTSVRKSDGLAKAQFANQTGSRGSSSSHSPERRRTYASPEPPPERRFGYRFLSLDNALCPDVSMTYKFRDRN